MKWYLLSTFTLAFALTGSFTEAAKAQSISQITLSEEPQLLQPNRSAQTIPIIHEQAAQNIVPTQREPSALSVATFQTSPQSFPSSPTATVEASTTIMVSFPARHFGMMDDGKHQMTVPLMQALRDRNGNVVVPEFSPVQVELSPHRDTIRLQATAIDIDGRMVEIETSTLELGTIRAVQTSQYQQASDNRLQLSDVGSGVGALVGGGESKSIIIGSLLGNALSWLFNDNSADHIYEVMIPEGETYMMELLEPITVPVTPF